MSGVGVAMSKVGKMDYKEELKKLIDEIDDLAEHETIIFFDEDDLFDRLTYFHGLAMKLKQKISLEEMYE